MTNSDDADIKTLITSDSEFQTVIHAVALCDSETKLSRSVAEDPVSAVSELLLTTTPLEQAIGAETPGAMRHSQRRYYSRRLKRFSPMYPAVGHAGEGSGRERKTRLVVAGLLRLALTQQRKAAALQRRLDEAAALVDLYGRSPTPATPSP